MKTEVFLSSLNVKHAERLYAKFGGEMLSMELLLLTKSGKSKLSSLPLECLVNQRKKLCRVNIIMKTTIAECVFPWTWIQRCVVILRQPGVIPKMYLSLKVVEVSVADGMILSDKVEDDAVLGGIP